MAYSRKGLYVLRSFPLMTCFHQSRNRGKAFSGTVDEMLDHISQHYYNNDAPETDYDHILTRMAEDIIAGKP